MLENIPEITDEIIKETISKFTKLARGNKMGAWMDTEMKRMEIHNKILADYVKEHAEKFALACMVIQDHGAIVTSKILEEMILMFIIDTALEKEKIKKEKINELDNSIASTWGNLIDDILKDKNNGEKS